MHPSELLHHWNEQDALGLEMSASPDQMVAEACLCRSLIKSMWCCLTLKVWHAHSTGLAMESRPQDQGQDRGIWVSHQQRRHHLTVKIRITKIPCRLCARDPPSDVRSL